MSESDPIPLETPKRRDQAAVWWNRVVEKYLFPLAVLGTVAVVTSAVGTWISVQRLADKIDRQEAMIATQRADMDGLRNAMVSRAEIAETMKRVEQQMEIMMLRARDTPVPRR